MSWDTKVSEDYAASTSILKMEAAWPSEMLVPYITAWCCNAEDHNMNLDCVY
jgi:hypothetical protein